MTTQLITRAVRALGGSTRHLAVLAGCLVLSATATASSATASGVTAARAQSPTAGRSNTPSASAAPHQLILIGVTGLRWSDVRPRTTPNLWRLASTSSLANLSGRTVLPYTCAADGWLTLGAGVRARMPASAADPPMCASTPPQLIRSPTSGSADTAAAATVADVSAINRYNEPFHYSAQVGVLGDLLAARGVCATAVGPGAALALARSSGGIPRYLAAPDDATTALLAACPLTVVDSGGLPTDAAGTRNGAADAARDRAATSHAIDQRVGRLLAATPPAATVLVAGVGDGETSPGLAAVMARDLDPAAGQAGRGWLTTRSTRHVGLAQLTDLTPTMLRAITGAPGPATLTGSVVNSTPARSESTSSMIAALVATDRADTVVTRMIGGFFLAFGVLAALTLALGLLLTYRQRRRDEGRQAAEARSARSGARLFTHATALSAAAVPVATFLANLTPWSQWPHPALLLSVLSVAIAAVIAVVALLGPWRRAALGPAGLVCGVTVAVLTIDIAAGSPTQLNALFGLSPTVGGRFYGFGNTAWAIYAVAAIMLAGAIAAPLVAAGRRRLAVLAVVVVGVVTVTSDGWPGLGADFGGMLALAPSFALLALLVAGVRVSVARLSLVGLGAFAVVFGVAILDWLRPPDQRTHLGAFVQQVFHGDATATLGRKIEANLHSLTAPLAFAVPLAFVVVALAIWSPGRLRATAVSTSFERLPHWRSTLIAAYAVAVLGFLTNDSGISIPAACLLIGLPLAVAVTVAASEVAPTPVVAPEPTATPRR